MNRIGLRILLFIALAQIGAGVWAGNLLYARQFEWLPAVAKIEQQFPCNRNGGSGTCVAVHFALQGSGSELRTTTVIAQIRNRRRLATFTPGSEQAIRYDPKKPMQWEPVAAQRPLRWILWGLFMGYAMVVLGATLKAVRYTREPRQLKTA